MRLSRLIPAACLLAAGGLLAGLVSAPADAIPPIPKAGAKPAPKHPRGRKAPDPEVLAARHEAAFGRHRNRVARLPKATAEKYDCRTLGYVLPVNDQGQCGDCFGVSTVDICAMSTVKAGRAKNDESARWSAQYGLDCGGFRGGCNGGDEAQVFEYAKTHGFPLASDYPPYRASEGRCQTVDPAKLLKIADWGYCTPNQQNGVAAVQDIKDCIVAYGPVSTALVADSSWDGYQGGPLPFERSSPYNVDHAVTIIGWDDTIQAPGAPQKGVFVVLNQWGKSWGMDGCVLIAYGSHQVGTEAIWCVTTPLPPPPPPVPPAPPVPPTPPVPPAPVGPATVTIPDLPVYVGGVHIGHAQGGTFPVSPKSMPVTTDKGLSLDVVLALIQLARDIQASGHGQLIADFQALTAAIRDRAGILAALEQLGTDLLAVGTDPKVLADLLRIAADLGIDVPAASVLRTGKACCGK